jgi:hypothetical protein
MHVIYDVRKSTKTASGPQIKKKLWLAGRRIIALVKNGCALACFKSRSAELTAVMMQKEENSFE